MTVRSPMFCIIVSIDCLIPVPNDSITTMAQVPITTPTTVDFALEQIAQCN